MHGPPKCPKRWPNIKNKEYRQYRLHHFRAILPLLSYCGILGHYFGHYGGPGKAGAPWTSQIEALAQERSRHPGQSPAAPGRMLLFQGHSYPDFGEDSKSVYPNSGQHNIVWYSLGYIIWYSI